MTSTFEYLKNVPTEYLYYEEEVLRDPFTLKKWLFYLDALKYAPPKVKFSVYERAVAALPRSYKLWTMYLRERQEYTKKRHPDSKAYWIVNKIYERSLVYLNKVSGRALFFVFAIHRDSCFIDACGLVHVLSLSIRTV